MVQMGFELTFVALFVILIFVGSIAVPIYVLVTRGRWAWALVYCGAAFVWTWALQRFTGAEPAVPLTAAQEWWSHCCWLASLVFYMSVGLMLGTVVRRQWSATTAFLLPVGVGGALMAAFIAGMAVIGPHFLGQPAGQFLAAELSQMIQQSVDMTPSVPPSLLPRLKELGAQVITWSVKLLPATIWLMGFAVTALTLLMGKWMVPRELWMKYQGGLTRWKAPGLCVWLVILLGGLYFASTYGPPLPWVLPVVVNGLLGLMGIFLLQGAMIVSYYVRRQREGIFRWMWYGLVILFFQTAVIVMVLLGVFDYWVDFRRVERKIVL